MQKVEIKLNTPIEVDGVKYDALTMREPLVNDMLLIEESSKSNARKEVQLFANLCEVAPETIGKLTQKDYAQLQKAFNSFL